MTEPAIEQLTVKLNHLINKFLIPAAVQLFGELILMMIVVSILKPIWNSTLVDLFNFPPTTYPKTLALYLFLRILGALITNDTKIKF
ncbi:MAG: hypothetical protein IT243_05025 [Bacteroidia bacterium]|nr:hypothetical protein [Bacteroidia bacterium]